MDARTPKDKETWGGHYPDTTKGKVTIDIDRLYDDIYEIITNEWEIYGEPPDHGVQLTNKGDKKLRDLLEDELKNEA